MPGQKFKSGTAVRSKQRQARNRRYETRQKNGCIVVKIQLGPAQIDQLEASRWLDRREVHQRHEIEAALQGLVDASLK
jgi:hypothetical protein